MCCLLSQPAYGLVVKKCQCLLKKNLTSCEVQTDDVEIFGYLALYEILLAIMREIHGGRQWNKKAYNALNQTLICSGHHFKI